MGALQWHFISIKVYQITSNSVVCPTISGLHQQNTKASYHLPFVMVTGGSPQKRPVMQKAFPFCTVTLKYTVRICLWNGPLYILAWLGHWHVKLSWITLASQYFDVLTILLVWNISLDILIVMNVEWLVCKFCLVKLAWISWFIRCVNNFIIRLECFKHCCLYSDNDA